MFAVENPKIKKPAYKKDDFVVLKINCFEIEDFPTEYLTKGALWIINECGCSEYALEMSKDTGKVQLSTITDGEEWCYISKTTTDLDQEEVQACIRAKDLELYSYPDID